jgi:uncharacterized membrane protein
MATPPTWVLAVIYWLHMLSTVTWIGCLAAILIMVLPASARTLKPLDQLSFISAVQKRLEPISWFSIGVLAATGLVQMSVNPHYDGYTDISTQWSIAMLLKHLLGVGMIVVMAIQTWEVLPAIHRLLLLKDRASEAELARLNRNEMFLLRANLILAALVLLATAFARAA